MSKITGFMSEFEHYLNLTIIKSDFERERSS